MFDDLLLHDNTRSRLENFTGRPAHALLISGPAGAGKKYLARRLAAELLGVEPAKLDSQPHLKIISKPADKSEITIDSARQLISKLSLRVPGAPKVINRIAIIEDADQLSAEAQNALLKLLEEPPAATLLILTSSWPQRILPTVTSRLQKITLQPVTFAQSLAFFEADHKSGEIESAWRLSRGAPSLLKALLAEGSDHQMKQAVEEAKKVISLRNYERLSYIQQAAKDKNRFAGLLDALSRVLGVLQQANAGNQNIARKVLKARKAVNATQESLDKNTNVRLLALNLALSIPL